MRHFNNLSLHTLIQVGLLNPDTYIRCTFTEGSFNNTTYILQHKAKIIAVLKQHTSPANSKILIVM